MDLGKNVVNLGVGSRTYWMGKGLMYREIYCVLRMWQVVI